jgi:hypothetical protein
MAHKISFNARWLEELIATSDEGILIFELTMGKLTVYFPDQDRWLASVPGWAKGQWKIYQEACKEWCAQQKIPMLVVDNALVYEEKK